MNRNKKINFLSILLVFLILILIVFCYNYYSNLRFENYNFKFKDTTKILTINKIIIVGDSRMELIKKQQNKMNLPKSIIFDAKSGARINWLYSNGIPKLYEILENENYNYHVIFNLGVNDMNSDIPIKNLVNEYFDAYKKIIITNNKIKFYILSVNPIDEDIIYKVFDKDSKRTTEKVETFNNKMIELIKKENIINLEYCDSYNSINFEMPDGLHYSYKTDKEIMKYIIEKCVKY